MTAAKPMLCSGFAQSARSSQLATKAEDKLTTAYATRHLTFRGHDNRPVGPGTRPVRRADPAASRDQLPGPASPPACGAAPGWSTQERLDALKVVLAVVGRCRSRGG